LFPLMAMLTLKELFSGNVKKNTFINGLKYAGAIIGGLCLLFALLPGMFFDFTGMADAQLPEWLRGAIAADRESLLRTDALRSILYIALAVAILWFMMSQKLKKEFAITGLALLIIIDLWGVDKRYLNDKDFERKKADAAVPKTPVDEAILQDTDLHYRVYNNTTDFDKDAITAYYHKSLGGYHGAKMRRYQELIEWHLSKQNMEVYNMLNAKYFIVTDTSRQQFVQRNPFANGNAWFVNNIKWVKNADEEIKALTGLKTKETAVVDEIFKNSVGNLNLTYNENTDTAESIKLTLYQPNKLVYESNTTKEHFTVFSEIFYDKGWNAYVDDKLVPHVRANYVLRAMPLPAGKHTITFKFEPQVVETGERIAYASSIALYISLAIAFALGLRKKK